MEVLASCYPILKLDLLLTKKVGLMLKKVNLESCGFVGLLS